MCLKRTVFDLVFSFPCCLVCVDPILCPVCGLIEMNEVSFNTVLQTPVYVPQQGRQKEVDKLFRKAGGGEKDEGLNYQSSCKRT